MRRGIILLLCIGLSQGLYAQGLGDWFNQKATQKKLLIQQIAALKVYTEYLQKGYKIAKVGLKTIHDFKDGEFNLHKLFFNSLKSVNPKIKKYPKISDIILMQLGILQTYTDGYRKARNSTAFTIDELKYFQEVFRRILSDCEESVSELIDIVTDGTLEMKDDERLERIDRLYIDVEDMYVFSQAFANETLQLGASRLHEQQELKAIEKWFDLE